MHEIRQEGEQDAPCIDSFQIVSRINPSYSVNFCLSLVQKMVIISLIFNVIGVIELHLVATFSRLFPSSLEFKQFIVLYALFLLMPIISDNLLMLCLSTSLFNNISLR